MLILLFLASAALCWFAIDKLFDLADEKKPEVPVTRYMEPQHSYRIAIDSASCWKTAQTIRRQFSKDTDVTIFTGNDAEIARALRERTIDIAIVKAETDMPYYEDYGIMYTKEVGNPIEIKDAGICLHPISREIINLEIIYRAPLNGLIEKSAAKTDQKHFAL